MLDPIEVTLPLPLGAKWVAHGCRTAGFAKPKWDHVRGVWTTESRGVPISITGNGEKIIRLEAPAEDARRLVSAIVTAMQWRVRRTVVDTTPDLRPSARFAISA